MAYQSVWPLSIVRSISSPRLCRRDVLTREHDPGHAGHPGVNKMHTSMRRAFYWDTMVPDVAFHLLQLSLMC